MDSSLAAIIWCPILIVFFAILVAVIWWQDKRYKAMQARLKEIEAIEQPIELISHWNMRFQANTLNSRKMLSYKRDRGVFSVSEKRLVFFEYSLKMPEILSFRPDQIRWFGRPQKYHNDRNEIWIHVEKEDGWMLFKLWLYHDPMRDLVRALKQVTPPELTTAYRRQRPYIHVGPVKASPAAQDIHGAWILDEAIDLYVMPRYLVALKGETVLRKIPLEAMQEIAALKRLDAPQSDGLVRFRAEEEPFAFALAGYEEFGQALAEAAKRTLEVPLLQKQKGKKEDEYDEDDE